MDDGARVCQITSGEDKVTDTPLVNLLMNTLQDFNFQSYKLLMNNLKNINYQKIKKQKELRFQHTNAFNQLYASRRGVRGRVGRLSSAGLHNGGCI